MGRSGAADAEGDRRQVTVLFADLTGFTSLAERLDPEITRAFQNALFGVMAQVIARYDGFVEKFVGDAVMAVFGAPRAHEDDPVRAVEAAHDMLHAVEALGAQWARRLHGPVTLHIAVHTGPVVAGSLGAGTGSAYAVTGDTVNTAARLLAAAQPGTVLVSDATKLLVQHRFSFEQAADLELRGKSQRVCVHRSMGLRVDAASGRGLDELGLAAPLVGRGASVERVLCAFDAMQRGHAQVVTLVGEAGAGKSRLLSEVLARLEADGRLANTAVRRATCSSLGEPAYGTFSALFREAYLVDARDSLEVAQRKLQRGLAELGADAAEADAITQVLNYLLGIEAAEPRDIEPEQLQRQITLAARTLLERRLGQQPLLVVIDDLQWADAASVDLLGRVVDPLAEQPFMLLLAQRPEARALPTGRAGSLTIELGPLAEAEMSALVGHLLGTAADDSLAAVRQLVVARAGGNPLFIEEIVRGLVQRGALTRRHDRWECSAGCGVADVPPTLYGLLLSRIDRLATDERRTLQEAAVLGAEFDGALLGAVAGDATSTAAGLQRLASAALIKPAAPGADRWRFSHALLHEVAYQNLLLTRRTELHGRAGEALENARDRGLGGPPRLVDLEALGYHWSLSSDKPRGARYLLAAGDWARTVYANDDAIRNYERTLQTLADAALEGAASTEAQSAALEAHERLADLLGLQGRRAAALEHYQQAGESLEGQHSPARAARLLRKVGGLHWEAGERERAKACFAAGLERLGDPGDPIERGHLFQEMGRLAFCAGDHAGALSLAEQALAEVTADTAEAAVLRAQARNTLGVALARLGRSAEAVTQIERSVSEAEAHQMLQAACRGYTNLAVLYASLDPPRSIATCLRGLEIARRVGDLGYQSRLYANLAVAYCALTHRCEAEGVQAAQAAAQLDRSLGLLDHLAVPLIVLGQIHQCHGNHASAFSAYREALQLAQQVDDPQLLFPCYDGLATLYLDTGDTAQAETCFGLAKAVCDRAGLEPDALMVLPFLC